MDGCTTVLALDFKICFSKKLIYTVACLRLAVKLEMGELQDICFRLGKNGREHMRSATSIGHFL